DISTVKTAIMQADTTMSEPQAMAVASAVVSKLESQALVSAPVVALVKADVAPVKAAVASAGVATEVQDKVATAIQDAVVTGNSVDISTVKTAIMQADTTMSEPQAMAVASAVVSKLESQALVSAPVISAVETAVTAKAPALSTNSEVKAKIAEAVTSAVMTGDVSVDTVKAAIVRAAPQSMSVADATAVAETVVSTLASQGTVATPLAKISASVTDRGLQMTTDVDSTATEVQESKPKLQGLVATYIRAVSADTSADARQEARAELVNGLEEMPAAISNKKDDLANSIETAASQSMLAAGSAVLSAQASSGQLQTAVTQSQAQAVSQSLNKQMAESGQNVIAAVLQVNVAQPNAVVSLKIDQAPSALRQAVAAAGISESQVAAIEINPGDYQANSIGVNIDFTANGQVKISVYSVSQDANNDKARQAISELAPKGSASILADNAGQTNNLDGKALAVVLSAVQNQQSAPLTADALTTTVERKEPNVRGENAIVINLATLIHQRDGTEENGKVDFNITGLVSKDVFNLVSKNNKIIVMVPESLAEANPRSVLTELGLDMSNVTIVEQQSDALATEAGAKPVSVQQMAYNVLKAEGYNLQAVHYIDFDSRNSQGAIQTVISSARQEGVSITQSTVSEAELAFNVANVDMMMLEGVRAFLFGDSGQKIDNRQKAVVAGILKTLNINVSDTDLDDFNGILAGGLGAAKYIPISDLPKENLILRVTARSA
ncbi:MAG: hypothetical protein NC924_09480, partial [Candidatus Omnitrophica bacterium]|nr:hypothetical protein [Candidatus Omnitrophota bacterium]